MALIQLVFSASLQNLSGRPKAGSCAAMRRHRSQPPPLLEVGAVGGGAVLGAEGRVLHAAAGGEEQQVVLRQVQGLLPVRGGEADLPGGLFSAGDLEAHVHDLCAVVELHPGLLQVLDHGQNHGLILVVAREAQGAEIRQAADVMNVAAEVELHLQGAVPILKGEHGAPIEPEIRIQHRVAEEVRDGAVVERLVRGEEQAQDL